MVGKEGIRSPANMYNMIKTIEQLENTRGEVHRRKDDIGLRELEEEIAFEMDFTG